jgi:hypothetical protein
MDYIGIFANGNYTVRKRLSDMTRIIEVEYIIEIETAVNHRGFQYNNHLTLIQPNGEPNNLVIGSFQLVEIGNSGGHITIKDNRLSITFQIPIKANPYKYVHEGILPIMNRLNELGSYAAYLVQLENETLTKENEKLRLRIAELEIEGS